MQFINDWLPSGINESFETDSIEMKKYYQGRKKYYTSREKKGKFGTEILEKWNAEMLIGNLSSRLECESLKKGQDSFKEGFYINWVREQTLSAIERSYVNYNSKKKRIYGGILPIPDRYALYQKKRKEILKAIVKRTCEIATETYSDTEYELASMPFAVPLIHYMRSKNRKKSEETFRQVCA
jgi:hypothetical protein